MTRARRVAVVLLNVLLFWAALPVAIYAAGVWVTAALGFGAPCTGLRIAGAVLAVAGLALALAAIGFLRWIGKGLPISALPPTVFVATGPYQLCRHPIYTGYALAAAGVGLAVGCTGLSLVVVPAVTVLWFATWVALYEEPGLLRRFGNSYRVYRDRTPVFLPFSLRRIARRVVLALFRLVFKVSVEGLENVPARGPTLFVCDHLSYLDFIFGQYASPRGLAVPVTAEVFRHPLRAAFMRLMGAIPTRRYCPDPAAYLAMADEMASGGAVGIAVEGERSWTGRMSLPSDGVMRNLAQLSETVIPVAMDGAYRVWPRWGSGADRSQPITVRIGKPLALSGATPRECAHLLRDSIVALRGPDPLSADFAKVVRARPELTLWKCPRCGAEETISYSADSGMKCAACNTHWDCKARDVTLAGLVEQTRWALPDPLPSGPLLAAACEWREDADARLTLNVLQSLGCGQASLAADHLVWTGEGAQRRIALADVRSVTTERNDTLQLGTGRGVVQLVLCSASPWRWQHYVAALIGKSVPGGLMKGEKE